MLEIFAKAFVDTLVAYVSLGLVFAVPFVWIGVQRLDSEAQGSGVGFRLLILPGVAAFWPMFLLPPDARDRRSSVERNPHRVSSKS
jgi:hypothetical protein